MHTACVHIHQSSPEKEDFLSITPYQKLTVLYCSDLSQSINHKRPKLKAGFFNQIHFTRNLYGSGQTCGEKNGEHHLSLV